MTITDIAEPTRDVELDTEVDEQQDTEVEEKSFFGSYADWFDLGTRRHVDGDSNSNDDIEGEAAVVLDTETEQYQDEDPNGREEEVPPREVSSCRTRVSSSSSSSIPPPPQLQSPSGWQEEWSFGCIDIKRCPMIIKPFACLIQLLLFVAISAVATVWFFGITLIIFFFGGELLMYKATYEAKENNKLMKRYKSEGVNVDGNVERIWSDWEHSRGGSDSPDFILVERALIRYEGGRDDQYRMRIMPLTKHVKNSIGPQDTIPIVLLPRDPESGIPEVCVASLSWSPLSRILLFTFGLAISTMWTILPVCFLLPDEDDSDNDWGYFSDPYFNNDSDTSSQNDKADWRILVAIVLLVGVLPNALFFIWKGFRDCIQSVVAIFDKTRSDEDHVIDGILVWSV